MTIDELLANDDYKTAPVCPEALKMVLDTDSLEFVKIMDAAVVHAFNKGWKGACFEMIKGLLSSMKAMSEASANDPYLSILKDKEPMDDTRTKVD